MYLLNWNSELHAIEASFGGRIKYLEVRLFAAHLRDQLLRLNDSEFQVWIDTTCVHKIDPVAQMLLDECRETCLEYGASRVTYLTGDRKTADDLTIKRMDQVMHGKERYLAFASMVS